MCTLLKSKLTFSSSFFFFLFRALHLKRVFAQLIIFEIKYGFITGVGFLKPFHRGEPPTLFEKWSWIFNVHRMLLSYTRDRRLKVSSERLRLSSLLYSSPFYSKRVPMHAPVLSSTACSFHCTHGCSTVPNYKDMRQTMALSLRRYFYQCKYNSNLWQLSPLPKLYLHLWNIQRYL